MATIPLGNPVFTAAMRDAALAALENERFVHGESVFKFEEEFARAHGTRFAVSAASGSLALEFTLEALGIGPGKRVATTPMSFIATANAVLRVGATPTFSDIGRDGNMDLARARVTSPGCAALLPVHLYGRPFDVRGFRELAHERGIPLIEDACQAHGASAQGKQVGSWGDAAVFSFYPSKNMTVCGDGGMVTTNDESLARAIRKLTDCGRTSKYEHDVLATTARLNTVSAAIGRVQLKELPRWNENRRSLARVYRSRLTGVGDLSFAEERPGDLLVHHMFAVRTAHRDALATFLKTHGVETGVHYPIPIHLQPLYRARHGYRPGDYPESESWAREVLSLPLFPALPESSAEEVARLVTEFFAKRGI